MSIGPESSKPDSDSARFAAAPVELQAYFIFATLAIIGWAVAFFGPKSLKEAIIPYTGWVPGENYLFTYLPAHALVFAKTPSRRAFIMCRFAIVAILLIGIFGGYQPNFGNPYLKISQWQPIWTMIIPAIWIMVLLSPRMRRFYNSEGREA
jgi:hypothetical protein